jgi:hypothetical protein
MLKDLAGIDVLAMYPTHKSDPSAAAGWTYDTFLKAAEACAKAGHPFGLGLGQTGDSVNNTGIIYSAFGAELVNAKGEITVDSSAVNQVLDYGRKLAKFLPDDTVSYDDASNNRALISGKSALIMNPPSAWAVAKRDAPQVASDCWHFPYPTGPKGRYCPYNYCFYGVWSFGQNKSAAKSLVQYLQERKQVGEREIASEGTTCRRCSACPISIFGRRSSRPRARSTTTQSGRGMTHSRISLPIRRRRILQRRCMPAQSTPPCSPRFIRGNRTKR